MVFGLKIDKLDNLSYMIRLRYYLLIKNWGQPAVFIYDTETFFFLCWDLLMYV